MVCLVKLEIKESPEELKALLTSLKKSSHQKRIQALYWLKIGASNSIEHIAMLLGCHRTTVSRWFSLYRRGGIEALLKHKKKSGRPRKIPLDIEEKLRFQLQQGEGFSSYEEVQLWLKGLCGMDIPYATVYKYVHTCLKTKLKKLD